MREDKSTIELKQNIAAAFSGEPVKKDDSNKTNAPAEKPSDAPKVEEAYNPKTQVYIDKDGNMQYGIKPADQQGETN